MSNFKEGLNQEVLENLIEYDFEGDWVIVATYSFYSAAHAGRATEMLNDYLGSVREVMDNIASRYPTKNLMITQDMKEKALSEFSVVAQAVLNDESEFSSWLERPENVTMENLPRAVLGVALEFTFSVRGDDLQVVTSLARLNDQGDYYLAEPDKKKLN